MHWGIRITIIYIGFVALILTLVLTSMNSKVELVSKDYYQQELRYEERIRAMQNNNALIETIEVGVNQRCVVLAYPQHMREDKFAGTVTLFRPSDAGQDLSVAMLPDAAGGQRVCSPQLRKGLYKVQLLWRMGDKDYYKEEVVHLP
jgi:hypothetical protein